MSDSSIPTPVGITLDMHARGVRALTEPSGDVYSVRALDPEVAEQVVTQVLEAALAGRTVEPVEPDWTVAEAAVRQAVIDWALAYWIPANNLCSGVREHQQKMASNWADGSAPFITARVREGLRKAAAESSESGDPDVRD